MKHEDVVRYQTLDRLMQAEEGSMYFDRKTFYSLGPVEIGHANDKHMYLIADQHNKSFHWLYRAQHKNQEIYRYSHSTEMR